MKRACSLAAVMMLCSVAAGAFANTEVQPFAANFKGSKMFALFTARSRIELQRAWPYLLYTMDTTLRGPLIERRFRDCAVLRIDAGRLWPVEYRHIDEGDAKLDVHTRFDWAQANASTLRGGEATPQVVDIAWPTWDAMSFQVALMAAAPQRAAGSRETHHLVERGRLKEHQVEFVEPQRIVSRKGDDEVHLLLLPQQGWQPQRLTIDGVTIERTGAATGAPVTPIVAGAVPQCPARATP